MYTDKEKNNRRISFKRFSTIFLTSIIIYLAFFSGNNQGFAIEPLVVAGSTVTQVKSCDMLKLGNSVISSTNNTYSFFTNGTISIADSKTGNLVSINPPVIPSISFVLSSNSTHVLQEWTKSGFDLKIFYNFNKISCGAKITIVGTVPSGLTSITIPLTSNKNFLYDSVNHIVKFGNLQTVKGNVQDIPYAIAYNFTDAFDPTKTSGISNVSYGSNSITFTLSSTTFTIDPSTVTTTTSKSQSYDPYWKMVVANDGTWLFFYYDGTQLAVAKSANNGTSWSIESVSAQVNQGQIAVDYDKVNGRVGVAYHDTSGAGVPHFRYATNSGTTLSWSGVINLTNCAASGVYTSYAVVGNGTLVYADQATGGAICVAKSTNGGATWSSMRNEGSCGTQDCISIVVPLSTSNGDLMLMIQDFATQGTISYKKYISDVWDGSFTTLTSGGATGFGSTWSADYDSSGNVHFFYLKSDNTVQYKKYTGSWSADAQLSAATVAVSPSIAVSRNGTIWSTYIKGTTIFYQQSDNGGTTWRGENTLTSAETSPEQSRMSVPHGFNEDQQKYIFVTWIAGAASPWNIRIDTSLTGTGVTPPTAPTLNSVSQISPTSLNATWSTSSGATWYLVNRTSPSGGTLVNIKNTTSLFYVGTGLSAGTQYQYGIHAGNAGGKSAVSNLLSKYTVNIAPTLLNATLVKDTEIRLQWTNPSGNFSGFMIEDAAQNKAWSIVKSNTGNLTNRYDVTGLDTAVPFSFRVSTNYATGSVDAGTSSASSIASLCSSAFCGSSGSGGVGSSVSNTFPPQINNTIPDNSTISIPNITVVADQVNPITSNFIVNCIGVNYVSITSINLGNNLLGIQPSQLPVSVNCGQNGTTPIPTVCTFGSTYQSGQCVSKFTCPTSSQTSNGQCAGPISCPAGTTSQNGQCISQPTCSDGTTPVNNICQNNIISFQIPPMQSQCGASYLLSCVLPIYSSQYVTINGLTSGGRTIIGNTIITEIQNPVIDSVSITIIILTLAVISTVIIYKFNTNKPKAKRYATTGKETNIKDFNKKIRKA